MTDNLSKTSQVANLQKQTLHVYNAYKGFCFSLFYIHFVCCQVIKQTIMTTVYGVTPYGAKLQIQRQLEDLDGYPREQLAEGAVYLTKQTMSKLRLMFKSARSIQVWFVVN